MFINAYVKIVKYFEYANLTMSKKSRNFTLLFRFYVSGGSLKREPLNKINEKITSD